MSVEQLEAKFEAMPPNEREQFARWFDDHRHELIPSVESAQQREVLTRLAEIEANPKLLEPFEEADVERMIQETIHARAKKASTRRG